jgi:hypothetical protein
METKKFLEVLNKGIEIPKIQRDYAQGRENELDKLENFLGYIKNNLDNKVFLDFIYGTSKEKFIPIDGQQRLTTLFLIYFYVSLEDRFLEEFKNFTYEIRSSSRDFINALVKNWQDLKKDNIKKQIVNSNWFFNAWFKDPTIKAILNAFKVIEKYFKDVRLEDLNNIEFKFLDLEEFNLDEELYVKMNARGKPLNNFQNFKAEFEKRVKPYPEFDNEWLDFFWKRTKTHAEENFYEFLLFLAEMIYYENNTEAFDNNFYKVVKVLVENDKFLIDVLNNLEKIENALQNIQEIEMFSIEKIESLWNFKNISQKIIVFSLINYILEFEGNIVDYVRFIRNVLLMDKKWDLGIKYHQTIAIKDIKTYLRLFLELRDNDFYQKLIGYEIPFRGEKESVLLHEKEKTQIILANSDFKEVIQSLEDFKYFKGNISNVLVNDIEKLKNYNQAIKEIFKNEDSLIIRAWYSLEDFSIELDGWTNWGKRYYFGRAPYWDIILQHPQNKKALKLFLDKFLEVKDLKEMIDYSELDILDLDYYIIKYEEFTEKYKFRYISNDLNIMIYDKDKFLIEKLNNNNLIGYHINPFIYTIGKKLKEKYNDEFAYSAKGDDSSYLDLKGKGYIKYDKKEKAFIHYLNKEEIINRWNISDFGNDIIEEMIKNIEHIIVKNDTIL